jgi:8-oxo-dGTP pyrophosphatase MutT (NUDIX family)
MGDNMNFEPQKFFVGLMDFFSILLPGALLTYLLMEGLGPVTLGDRVCKELTGTKAWAAFLFLSYLFGHLIFLLGSWLDAIYDWVRHHTLNTQITVLARRGRLLPWPMRALVWLVFKRERNLAVDRAVKIKQQALDTLHANDSINAFQWCKALLNNSENQPSLAVVQRLEADSKFFRCFAVVLALVLAMWSVALLADQDIQIKWRPIVAIPLGIFLILLALWRYMEQRYKSTNQAYWSVITLTARDKKVSLDKRAAPNSPTHAGGVVVRKRWRWWGTVQYLLVEATDDPDELVLPKGHIDEGELPRETAVREVLEETGVWARIAADLGDVSYSISGTLITVRFYFMRRVTWGLKKDRHRRHIWLPLEKATCRINHEQTRKLLVTAERMRVAHDYSARHWSARQLARSGHPAASE